jgi:voltage-gated potassium channel Kch
MSHLTVKEMKEVIADLDDDTIICGSGHFGESLGIEIEGVKTVTLDGSGVRWQDNKKVEAFVLNCQDAGPDPD